MIGGWFVSQAPGHRCESRRCRLWTVVCARAERRTQPRGIQERRRCTSGGELVSDASVVSAPDSAPACRTHKELRLDLDGDCIDELMVWTRCGAVEARPEVGGGTVYPVDNVSVRRATGEQIVYSNAESPEAEAMSNLEQVRIGGGIQALVVWRGYGTGNFYGWTVVDLRDGRLRSWSNPIPEERSHQSSSQEKRSRSKRGGA